MRLARGPMGPGPLRTPAGDLPPRRVRVIPVFRSIPTNHINTAAYTLGMTLGSIFDWSDFGKNTPTGFHLSSRW